MTDHVHLEDVVDPIVVEPDPNSSRTPRIALAVGLLMCGVFFASGVAMISGHSSSMTGSCCVPDACDANKLTEKLLPGRQFTCMMSNVTAERIGCPGIDKALRACNYDLSYNYMCDADRAKTLAHSVAMLAIVLGVLCGIIGGSWKRLLGAKTSWNTSGKRASIGFMIVLLLGLFIGIYVVGGMVLHRIFVDPFWVQPLSVCTRSSTGANRRCYTYNYPTFTNCSALDKQRAVLYSWVDDASGYRVPAVLIVVAAGAVPLFLIVIAAMKYYNRGHARSAELRELN